VELPKRKSLAELYSDTGLPNQLGYLPINNKA